MANTTTKVDLVINRMSQSKYEQLKSAGQLDPNQIYMTTDGIDPVPDTRKVNGQTLEADVTLTGADIAVSTTDTTKINSALAAKAAANHTHSNYVPTSRTINSKALSGNVTLTGADIAVSTTDSTKIDAALAGNASKSDATLTPIYSQTPTFSEWVFTPEQVTDPVGGVHGLKVSFVSSYSEWRLRFSDESFTISVVEGNLYDTSLQFPSSDYIPQQTVTATRTRTDIIGYQLGTQTDKPLASEAEAEALRTAVAGKVPTTRTINGKALSADVTLTGADIAVSTSDSTKINTALSNKASSTHTHGNITNAGALQTTDIAIANGDKLVVTDASDSSKAARTSLAFDGSTTTQFLSKKGTWEAPVITGYVSKAELATAIAAVGSIPSGDNANLENTIAKFNLLIQKLTELAS